MVRKTRDISFQRDVTDTINGFEVVQCPSEGFSSDLQRVRSSNVMKSMIRMEFPPHVGLSFVDETIPDF